MKSHSFFRTSGFIPENIISTDSGQQVDLSKISPFLRTLLVTDGTVTKSLEAWFWEEIQVEALSNQLETIEENIEGLNIEKGDQILMREVNLKGKQSDTTFAYAKSIVSLKHLSDEIGNALVKGEIGIGEILREKDVETYRDIFNINYFTSIEKEQPEISSLQGEVISRSYRIRVNGAPSIIVNEFFPVALYQ